jgi:hypothetical protein
MPVLFLTGISRSGTTWAAQGLAALARARYVHEPFNRMVHPELAQYNMLYLPPNLPNSEFLAILNQKLRPRGRRRKIREFLLGRNLVFKDVNACFAAECIQAHLDASIVILARHPCAIAASWKTRGWIREFAWRFDILLGQATLLRFLSEFETHMRSPKDLFFQFGAYWGAMYHVLRQLALSHPEWQWVVHDQLCQDPVPAFRRILESLQIPVSAKPSDFFTVHDRPLRENENFYQTYRQTKLVPEKWREILSEEEIQAVLEGAEPFRPDVLLRSQDVATADVLHGR